MKKIISIILVMMCILTSITTINADEVNANEKTLSFSDVKSTDWFYNNVTEMIELGIVNGYEDRTFRPQGEIKADEFIKMVLVAMGYEPCQSDSTYWADGYITKAEELKIVDKTFINDYRYNLTREQASRIIVNALSLKETKPVDTYNEYIKTAINDYHLIADKYKQDVIDCYAWGIMQGDTTGKINPKQTITRAETTTVILRIINKDRRLGLDFEAKSISGYNADGEYATLIAPMLNGKPVNEMIDVAYILQEQIQKSKGAEFFGVGIEGLGLIGYETKEKREFVSNVKTASDFALAVKYIDFDFTVDFLDYKGENRPYELVLWKRQGSTVTDTKYQYQFDKYCEYFMEYYKEPFYEVFKLLFEDEVNVAWSYFEKALKNQDVDNTMVEIVINDRAFFINYSGSYINMIISLKGQYK